MEDSEQGISGGIVPEFDKTVLSAFKAHGLVPSEGRPLRLGAGVSGGADSVSLLLSLVRLFGSGRVFVLTVNHRIRTGGESDADCRFVEELCGRLGVPCAVAECGEGEIFALSAERGLGLEESARFARYRAFEAFIRERRLDVFCLAHTKNDQLETVLMRFLQGVDGGIAARRGPFFRPLLGIPRESVERYLRAQNEAWRTDSTNMDDGYYRNRVRNRLVPLLDELFPGWRRSVLSFAEKNAFDAEHFADVCGQLPWERRGEDCVCMDAGLFFAQQGAVRRRLVLAAFTMIGAKRRISYRMIRPLLFWRDDGESHRVRGAGVEVFETAGAGGRLVFVRRSRAGDPLGSGFYFLVRGEAELLDFCEAFFGERRAVRVGAAFPFVVRSFFAGDVVSLPDGRAVPVAEYFSRNGIGRGERGNVPFVQLCAGGEKSNRVFPLPIGEGE